MFINLMFDRQASLNWGKKDEPVYVTEESGVVGLNFHQSKEVLIHDTTNGVGSHYDVITRRFIYTSYKIHTMLRLILRKYRGFSWLQKQVILANDFLSG